MISNNEAYSVDDDRTLIHWAGEAVKKPWFKMVEVGQTVVEGRPSTVADRQLEIPLFPIPVDGKIVAWFLQKFLSTLLVDNGSMHTIIINRKGDRIVWSCIEAVHKGTYSEIHELGPKELDELNRTAIPLLVRNNMKGAYRICERFAKSRYRVKLGIVKVAHLQFFEEFKKVYERSHDGALLVDHIAGVLGAVTSIFRNGWLRFHPPARIFNLLGKMITRDALDISPDDLKSVLTSFLPTTRIAIGLHSNEWAAAIELQTKEDGDLSIKIHDADFSQSCWNASKQRFADEIRERLKAPVSIVVGVDELLQVLASLMEIGETYNNDTFAALVATLGRMFPKYGEAFAISPKPNLYKRRYKWAYGIDLTRDLKVPATAVTRGIPLFLGSNGAFAFGILGEHGELLSLLQIQMRGALVRSIRSLDKKRYAPIVMEAFKKHNRLKLMQATKALKFAITEDTEQWLNYCVLVKKSSLSRIMRRVMQFIKHVFWTGLLKPGEFRKFIRQYMSREALTTLLEEKLTVYPSNPIFKLIEEKGIWTYKWPL